MAPPEPLAELNRSIRLLRQATAASWLVPPFMLVVPVVCFMNALAALGKTDRGSEVPMTVVLFATYLLPGLFAARCAFAGARETTAEGRAPRHGAALPLSRGRLGGLPDIHRRVRSAGHHLPCPRGRSPSRGRLCDDALRGYRADLGFRLLRLLPGRTAHHPDRGSGLRVLELDRQRHAPQTG